MLAKLITRAAKPNKMPAHASKLKTSQLKRGHNSWLQKSLWDLQTSRIRNWTICPSRHRCDDTGNTNYPSPPVTMANLQTAKDDYTAKLSISQTGARLILLRKIFGART